MLARVEEVHASAAEDAGRIIKPVTQQVQSTPFTFLQNAESENLLTFIQDEHPQTIALILAHLQPTQTAAVLKDFAPELGAEVVFRMATMSKVSPDMLARAAEKRGPSF